MTDTEGSVMVDGVSPDIEDETVENVNNQDESSKAENSEKEAESSNQEAEVGQDEGNTSGDSEVSDKGTKLDPDPLSRANQLRANAEARAREVEGRARQMEALLNNPRMLKAYLEQVESENKQSEEDKPITPDDIETVDDLKRFAKQLDNKSQQAIKSVMDNLASMQIKDRVVAVNNNLASEIKQVQEKYPELREFNADGSPNPEYNKELDEAVGYFYNSLDKDPQTGFYRGQHSMLSVADRFMKAQKIGEKRGSEKAQTIVKDKRTGRIITNQGGASNGLDESSQSAESTIAARMKRAASRLSR